MGSPGVVDPILTPELAPTERGGGSRRRIRLAVFASLLLGALAAVAVALLDSRSPAHPSSATGTPPGQSATTVTRRTLTESATVSGTLGYAGSVELYDRLSSAGTFT